MLRIESADDAHPLDIVPPDRFADTVRTLMEFRQLSPAQRAQIDAIQHKLTTGQPITYHDTHGLGIAVRTLSTAEAVAEGARQWFRRRAEREDADLNSCFPEDHWGHNHGGQVRFAAALHSGNVAITGEREVTASVPTEFGHLGTHLASDALDHGGQWLPDTSAIRDIDPYTAAITW
ncbi:hypothetical protein AB0L82_35995 [Nocardia sp. NPDC052001]|uniref:hypothetical protein n=1 Tax=Nocardia sp. NPDC052001 TaxID=3154853 RepID=UPI0034419B5C